MQHKLEYKYNLGDVLKYHKEVTLLLQEPDGTQLEGINTEEMVQQVVEDHDGWWKVRLEMRTLSNSGPLCAEIPPELVNRTAFLNMDLRGTVLDLGEGGPPTPRVTPFPQEPVGPGQTWTAVATSPDGGENLHINYHFERIEEVDGETLAHLVTLAESVDAEQGYKSETQGTIVFSVTHGHQLASTTVVKLTWESGRVSHSVVELKLESRAASVNI